MKIRVYVLTGRCGTDMLGTSVSTNLKKLQREMAKAFENTKNDLDGDYEESGTGCGADAATVVTGGDWYEWELSTHSIKFDVPVSFKLPNGVTVEASAHGDVGSEPGGEWKSLDITARLPSGAVQNLCAVDWDSGRGTRTLVFAPEQDDPIFTQSYELQGTPKELLKISIQELAARICKLGKGDILEFYEDIDKNGGCELYGVTRIEVFDASHILINYYGGNAPYVIDVTCEENEQGLVEESLTHYFEHCGIGDSVYLFINDKKGRS